MSYIASAGPLHMAETKTSCDDYPLHSADGWNGVNLALLYHRLGVAFQYVQKHQRKQYSDSERQRALANIKEHSQGAANMLPLVVINAFSVFWHLSFLEASSLFCC